MTDVRTLLHDTAEVPSRDPDIDGAMRNARDRRRRRHGLGALVAVVVVALVGGVFVATSGGSGDDSARVAIAPGQSTGTLDGWTQVHADPGLTIAIPPDWDSYDFGQTPVADVKFAVGTVDPGEQIPLGCPDPTRAAVTGSSGSWVSVWEYPAGSASVASPTEGTVDVEDREPFESAGVGATCGGGAFTEVAFRDAGRVFVARVVTRVVPDDVSDAQRAHISDLEAQIDALTQIIATHPPNESQLSAQLRALQPQVWATYGLSDDFDLAKRVLETLHVEPTEGVPATTAVPPDVAAPTPTLPLPTVTTLPPFVPSTDDEQAIQVLFESWLRHHSDDDTRAMVEDADALLESIHEGLAQHTPEDLALYSGTVSGIRMLDADHAEVQYTLLHDGRPQFGLRTGTAVRIDGRWMVSRATECALLSLGGITCPPPS